jgi:hypothetical protein
MRKPKITLKIPADRSEPIEVLYVGDDNDKAVKAFLDARNTFEGEVCTYRSPVAYRRWKGRATKAEPPKRRSKFSATAS